MCGKAVDPQKALKLSWEGKTCYFCSEECRQDFDQDPPGDAGF
jgi:YHS domain-containing protein